MKINKLKVNSYGKLKNKEINLEDNINIIYGKNEAGKSTLIKFIINSFYGASKNKKGKEFSDLEKYTPWTGEEFSGKIEYELDNKNKFEIFREFKKKNPKIFNEKMEDISKEFNIDKNKGNEFFYEQTKIDEELFLSTLIVNQQEVKLEKSEQNMLIQKIANLVGTGEDNISYKRAIDRINRRELDEVGTERSREKPINLTAKNIQKIEEEKYESEKYENLKYEIEENKNELIEEINNLENENSILKEIKLLNENKNIEKEKIKIKENIIKENNEKINLIKNELNKINEENNLKINNNNLDNSENKSNNLEINNNYLNNSENKKNKLKNKKIKKNNLKINNINSNNLEKIKLNKIKLKRNLILAFTFLLIINILQCIFITNKIVNVAILLTLPMLVVIGIILTKNINKQERINLEQQEEERKKLEEINLQNNLEISNLKNEIKIIENNNINLENEINKLKNNFNLDINLKKEKIKINYLNKIEKNKINYLINLENINNELENIQNNLNNKKLKLHSLELDKKNIEPKLNNLSKLEEELILEKEKLLNLQNLGTSMELAKEVLNTAYNEMRSSVTPRFTQNLSKNIENITNGKYTKVMFNDEEGLIVELDDGNYVPANRLSIGTIDQLYLSLRLSMVEDLSEEKMPIILDEAFAYYDTERLENILKYIYEKFNSRQVIIFTCTNREKEILNGLEIKYNLINI